MTLSAYDQPIRCARDTARRSPHPVPGLKILLRKIAGSAQSRGLLAVPWREDAAARSATWPQHQSRVSHGRHTAVVGAALPPPLRHSRGAAKSPPSRGMSYTRRTRFTSLPQGQGDPGEGRLLRTKWRFPRPAPTPSREAAGKRAPIAGSKSGTHLASANREEPKAIPCGLGKGIQFYLAAQLFDRFAIWPLSL